MEPESMDIRELVAAAALALSGADVSQHSGRVSEVPTVRTVRYYAGHGLIDAPAGHEGRKALYGRRHLEQIVAIKRLQSRGLTLVEIQERMLKLSSQELAALANLPSATPGGTATASSVGGGSEDGDEEPFWARQPAEVPEQRATQGQHDGTSQSGPGVTGLRLADGVLVVVEGPLRELDEDDRLALRAAAEPLLRVLQARRIAGAGRDDS